MSQYSQIYLTESIKSNINWVLVLKEVSSPFIAYQQVAITFKYYQVTVLYNTNMFETNEKSK